MSNSKFTVEITKVQNDAETAFLEFQVDTMKDAIAIIKQYPAPSYSNYVTPSDMDAYNAIHNEMADHQFATCKWYAR